MNEKEIKKKIEMLEYNANGLGMFCFRGVEVLNLRLTKNKAIADIKLCDYEEQSFERFNNCEYDLVKLGWI